VTDWVRQGDCNHCGFCCETLSRQFVVRQPVEPYWQEFYAARGFTDVPGGTVGRFAWLLAPCPQHVGDRCAMGDGKPARCAVFPTQPTEIVGTPCSYWFEAEGIRVGGEGSPFPCTEDGLLAFEAQMATELTT
jgi:hypothetical protein